MAGFGGQGVMLIGKLYASLAAQKYEHVTYFPSYGSEVRGGTAHCGIIIADSEIGSPMVEEADTVIVLNQMSAEKFKSRVVKGGLILVNSTLANVNGTPGAIKVPATEIANKLGEVRSANMVMLGAYLKHKPIVELSAAMDAIAKALGKRKSHLAAINQQALQLGYDL